MFSIYPDFSNACNAGVNARSVADVKLFNDIFSDCPKAYQEVKVGGLRVGYPKNFWEDLGEEVSISQRLCI